jgi:sulfate transporter 4
MCGLQVCAHTIRVVGVIPKGLPHATVSWWNPPGGIPRVGKKFSYAIIICLIDLLESISIAKALALKNRYEIR